jgi:hypothetical protein
LMPLCRVGRNGSRKFSRFPATMGRISLQIISGAL